MTHLKFSVKNKLKEFISILFFALILFLPVFSQEKQQSTPSIEISVCRPTLTDAGRQSNFHFTFAYRVKSDDKGKVESIFELLDHKKYKFLVNDSDLIPCIKKWKLDNSERYFVYINVGTTGENSLSITNKQNKIKILL